ncbi:hypothetical protein C8246_08665 [Paracidovorax avenae]|nr:hypothetical protein C8246_08665 [Paracidovorax avenae]
MVLSAMKSLLCMRCCTREKSVSDPHSRPTMEPRGPATGLNMRISMFGWNARPITSALRPVLWKSSSSTRTRTPRRAAATTPRSSRSLLASAWMA